MNSKQFMVGGGRWAATGTVTEMGLSNTLKELMNPCGMNVTLNHICF